MREILFRAKRLDNGEWVEGNLVFSLDADEEWKTIIIPIRNSYMFSSGNEDEDLGFENWHRVDLKTVGQYTGLTDKNGQKIWENDIIDAKDSWWNAYGPAGHSSPIILVEWSDYFCGYEPFANYDCDCGVYICPDEVKVIGNIFDNPELLKGGAE